MNDVDQQVQQEIIQTTNAQLLPETSLSLFREKLAEYIHELINNNFEKLVNILYRLDINEKKLKQVLISSPQADAGVLIAQMIIERQVEKIKSREQFRRRDGNICDEERW